MGFIHLPHKYAGHQSSLGQTINSEYYYHKKIVSTDNNPVFLSTGFGDRQYIDQLLL